MSKNEIIAKAIKYYFENKKYLEETKIPTGIEDIIVKDFYNYNDYMENINKISMIYPNVEYTNDTNNILYYAEIEIQDMNKNEMLVIEYDNYTSSSHVEAGAIAKTSISSIRIYDTYIRYIKDLLPDEINELFEHANNFGTSVENIEELTLSELVISIIYNINGRTTDTVKSILDIVYDNYISKS